MFSAGRGSGSRPIQGTTSTPLGRRTARDLLFRLTAMDSGIFTSGRPMAQVQTNFSHTRLRTRMSTTGLETASICCITPTGMMVCFRSWSARRLRYLRAKTLTNRAGSARAGRARRAGGRIHRMKRERIRYTFTVLPERVPAAARRPRSPLRAGHEPNWRADGNELYYLNGNKLMAVEVNGDGESFQAGISRVLLETPLAGCPEGTGTTSPEMASGFW